MHVLQIDLNDLPSLNKKCEEVLAILKGDIDILVNNGGISMRDYFENLKLSTVEQIMNVNYASHVRITHNLIQSLLKT